MNFGHCCHCGERIEPDDAIAVLPDDRPALHADCVGVTARRVAEQRYAMRFEHLLARVRA
jgi:recombinational DNA repair protein (RecF pathway)